MRYDTEKLKLYFEERYCMHYWLIYQCKIDMKKLLTKTIIETKNFIDIVNSWSKLCMWRRITVLEFSFLFRTSNLICFSANGSWLWFQSNSAPVQIPVFKHTSLLFENHDPSPRDSRPAGYLNRVEKFTPHINSLHLHSGLALE